MQIPPPTLALQLSKITTSLIINLLSTQYIIAYIPPPLMSAWHLTKELESLIVSVPLDEIVARIAPPLDYVIHQVKVELIIDILAPSEISRTIAPPDGFEQLVKVQFLIIQSGAEFIVKPQLLVTKLSSIKSAETSQKQCNAQRIINRCRLIALLACFE
ncbi:MAG: hypothetical protein EZS28_046589 [Streblomastix strix]|uniref:Uncharacterized protein n=1 Tax=Streblomastix strix TaxID=222440 RepID=A0A5J4THP3_9EUKA|nr:MAG: hypothetical protein EZS28_046589 [Streblomastix strix]